jgi:predicted restriction endonuclease
MTFSDVESRISKYLIQKRTRDTWKVKELKKLYQDSCQICGFPVFMLINELHKVSYSEVCHIQPHSKNGLDDYPNMMVLCPNHHIMFDIGIISIVPSEYNNNWTISHVDHSSVLNNSELKLLRHELSLDCVRYHYENVHLPVIKMLKNVKYFNRRH